MAGKARQTALPLGAAGLGTAAIGAVARAATRQPKRPRFSVARKTSRPQPTRNLQRSLDQARRLTSEHRHEALWVAAGSAGVGGSIALARRGRRPPIQCSLDVAVPIEVAYDRWMALEFLPEGAHRVEKIERSDNGALNGQLKSPLGSRNWEAEIRDERDCESFAWRSVKGSDCAGLITFHQLGERLTRLELQLDVIPVRPREAAELTLHLADRRAEAELRRFKSRLETINPDSYGAGRQSDQDSEQDGADQDDHEDKEA